MKTSRQKLGNEGERLAEAHLRSRGYRILGRQVRVGRMGELDLVAQDGPTVVFVEVKTRKDRFYGSPEEALTPAKSRNFSLAIQGYLASRGLVQVRHRADFIAVDLTGATPAIRHHQSVTLE
jgi:putative endonuclease